MKKAISFILALLAAVGKECYQTFVLGLVAAAVTAVLSLVCGLSLWTALARRGPRRPASCASRRKNPGREILTRRDDSLRGREPRNVAPARGRLSRKVKTDEIGA